MWCSLYSQFHENYGSLQLKTHNMQPVFFYLLIFFSLCHMAKKFRTIHTTKPDIEPFAHGSPMEM